ncbi:PEP-CTERM protein-sorting domain-containing protein [Verrucomicrobium sp. GAS474]|uniref:PEP-CTERM sorting domain-containing protein n=1 Tax=Verrucomicrobium sp. GAS474 TaxID=1882831 RepID=UPI0008798D90|nr:PEP-CTERM sorting domain-containing protein [Verrucomicrobium sp. GAS474]SDU11819.1 PEP-CTERM protein-sorting domain-containing protein [Verrucomicrobium sp. GAS474]
MKAKALVVLLATGAATWFGGNSSASAQVTGNYIGTTGGLWGTGTNWDSGTAPGALDTAAYSGAAGASTTVVYDATASGSLGTLQWGESNAGFTNMLDISKSGNSATPSLTIANDFTLSSSTGTAMVRVDATTLASYLKIGSTGTGTITLETGGALDLLTDPSRVASMMGNVAVNGGVLSFSYDTSGTVASTPTITGNVSMSAGTIQIANSADRVHINGNFSATGGSLTGVANSQLYLLGATNSISSTTTVSSNLSVYLSDAGTVNQTFNTDAAINNLEFVKGGGVKTISGSGTIANLYLGAYTASTNMTMKLGSNLAVTNGFVKGANSSNGVALGYTLDLNGFNFTLPTTNTLNFQNDGNGNAVVTWNIQNSSSTLSTLTAKNFVFNSGTTNNISGPITFVGSATSGGSFSFGGSGPATININGTAGTVTFDAGNQAFAFSGASTTATTVTTTGSVIFKTSNGGTAVDLSSSSSANATFGSGTVFWLTGTTGTANLGSASGTTALNSGVLLKYTGAGTASVTSNRTIGAIQVGDGTSVSKINATSALTLAGDLQVNAHSTFAAQTFAIQLTGAANLTGAGTLSGTAGYSFASGATGGVSAGGTGAVATLTMASGSSLTLVSTTVSNFDIASTSSTDVLNLGTSAITYGGTLNLNFLAGYNPNQNDTFTLVTNAGTVTGTFDNITSNLTGDTFSYNAATGVLTVTAVAVPEPSEWMLLLMGASLCGTAWLRRKGRLALC